jgi:hypothetical protein
MIKKVILSLATILGISLIALLMSEASRIEVAHRRARSTIARVIRLLQIRDGILVLRREKLITPNVEQILRAHMGRRPVLPTLTLTNMPYEPFGTMVIGCFSSSDYRYAIYCRPGGCSQCVIEKLHP